MAIIPRLRIDSTDVTEEEEAEKENPVSLQPTFQEGLLSTGWPPLNGRECSLTTFPSIHEHAKDSYTKCYVGKKSMQNLHYDDSQRRMCILGRDQGVVLGDRIMGDFVHDEMSLEVSIKLLFTKKLIEKMALL